MLLPLVALIRSYVTETGRLHGGDTTVPVLARGKTTTGRLWTYVRDDRPFAGPPPPVFFYSAAARSETLDMVPGIGRTFRRSDGFVASPDFILRYHRLLRRRLQPIPEPLLQSPPRTSLMIRSSTTAPMATLMSAPTIPAPGSIPAGGIDQSPMKAPSTPMTMPPMRPKPVPWTI